MSGILEDPIILFSLSPARHFCSDPSLSPSLLFFVFHLFLSSLVPESQVSFENNPSVSIHSYLVWAGLILLPPPGMGHDWLKPVTVLLSHRMFGSGGGQLSLSRKNEIWDLRWEFRATDTFSFLGLWCEENVWPGAAIPQPLPVFLPPKSKRYSLDFSFFFHLLKLA